MLFIKDLGYPFVQSSYFFNYMFELTVWLISRCVGSQVHQGSAASKRAEQPAVLLYEAHFRPQQAQVRPELPPPRASQQTVCKDAAD